MSAGLHRSVLGCVGWQALSLRLLLPDALASSCKHTIQLTYKYEGPGIGGSATGTLSVDGKEVAQGKMPRTIATRYSLDETFDVGLDTGTPVHETYLDKMPFAFTGTLGKFTIELK